MSTYSSILHILSSANPGIGSHLPLRHVCFRKASIELSFDKVSIIEGQKNGNEQLTMRVWAWRYPPLVVLSSRVRVIWVNVSLLKSRNEDSHCSQQLDSTAKDGARLRYVRLLSADIVISVLAAISAESDNKLPGMYLALRVLG